MSERRNRAPGLNLEPLEPRMVLSATPGLVGEYFNEIDLTDLASTRVDPTVNFAEVDWGDGPPGTNLIADDNYSERWTGFVNIETAGNWTFYTTSNDGVRLWIDDNLVINNWNQHTATEDTATLSLSAGWHSIRLEHFQQNGTVTMQLSFSGPGQSKTIIPSSHLSTEIPDAGIPVANAGPDKTIALPSNSVTLNGSGTDSNGTITSYQWAKISGPSATLSGVNTANLTANNLQQGNYLFRLTVTDNDGNTNTDDVQVNVVLVNGSAEVTGELRKWHKVTLTFDGPQTSETAGNNPFLNYRLDVTFTHGATGKTLVVPGYFAADGNAANTSATSGNKWRAHFAPPETGEWTWTASFRAGTNVAVADNPNAGSSAGFFDGASGVLNIAETDKAGRDLRGKGQLQYVGGHYLQFAETGEYFLKQGPDAPENLLAYEDFDNTPNFGNRLKSYSAHASDWNPGDPTWAGGKGTELIGAVNYLASEGLNAFSFLTMNINGDDRNVFPYISDSAGNRTRIDVSKVDQWEVVFEHATINGFFLHFKTQETENDQLLDGGNLGTERKLYYRELIARFSHHLALNWNLGEENTNTDQQRKDFAQYFHDLDPYDHHIVVHTYPGQKDQVYTPLLGDNSLLTGASLQGSSSNFSDTHNFTLKWVNESAAAGKPWAIAVDEPGDAQAAIRPDSNAGNSHEDGRKNALWGTLMAGGYGNEWYFGYGYDHSDLTLQDFRSRDDWWDYTRYALEFFNDNDVPFWLMQNANSITSNTNDYAFVQEGEVYVIYLKSGGTTNLNLSGVSGNFEVKWFDPRHGGALQDGTVTQVSGGGNVGIGNAPNSVNQDWTVLIRRIGTAPTTPAAPSGLAANAASTSQINLNWMDNSNNETSFQIQRATNSSFSQNVVNAFVGSNTTSQQVVGLDAGATYYFRVRAANSVGDSGWSNVSSAMTSPLATLPAPWIGTDIGAVAATGSASFSNGTFTVSGSGNDIWNATDEFHYVYQPLSGDGEIIAQVSSQTNTNQWAKAGLMIRESLAGNSEHAMIVITPERGVSFQYRAATGGSSSHQTTAGNTAPIWLRLVRDGNLLTAYSSSDGVAWTPRGQTTLSLNQDVFVGLAVTSHNDGVISTASFNNVQVIPAEPVNQPPVFNNVTTNLAENTPNGSSVMQLVANDPEDGFVTDYTILSGNTGNAFALVGSSLVVNNAAALDFETNPTFNLVVRATDSGGLTDTATVTINLIDVVESVGQITGWLLYNADTDQLIGSLSNGAVINLAAIGTSNLNIVATTSGPIGSIRFGLDGTANFQTENVPAYALFGNNGDNYNAGTFSLGAHTVTATPYSGRNASGDVGTSLSINFTVINDLAIAAAIG